MHPTLFHLGPVTLYTYGVLLALGYLCGLTLTIARAKSRGVGPSVAVLRFTALVVVAGALGARLLPLAGDAASPLASAETLANVWWQGGAFNAGLASAAIVGVWYLRRVRLPFWPTLDVLAPGISLGQIFGRVGCFFAGCCFGKPTTVPWAVVFVDPVAHANGGVPLGVPLHPTQLYEASAGAIVLAVLITSESVKRSFAGRTFCLWMLLYAISRFVAEGFRGDPRGAVGMFSITQFVSLILAPAAALLLVYLSSRRRQGLGDFSVQKGLNG